MAKIDQRMMPRDEKRVFWREHVEAWKLGNQSQKDYCQQHELAHTSFQKWRQRFKREDEVVERRAGSKRKKAAVAYTSSSPNQSLLAERVRSLRARIANQSVTKEGDSACGESRITRAR